MGRVSSGKPSLAYPIGWRGIMIMMVGLGVCLCRHSARILSASLGKSSRPINSRQLSRIMDINPGTISLYVQRLVEKGLVQSYPIPVCKLTIDELHIVWYSMAA
jgi:hypothetical protein